MYSGLLQSAFTKYYLIGKVIFWIHKKYINTGMIHVV